MTAQMVRHPDHLQQRGPSQEHGRGRAATSGDLPTICNIKVTKMMVDGGAGLNLLSPAVFEKMQVPPGILWPTRPFFGATPVVTIPIG